MTRVTCGLLFVKALEAAKQNTSDPLELFSWGHLVGQAEKVYLGACKAAMFRPSRSEQSRFIHRIETVCAIYGLTYFVLPTSRGKEYWICRLERLFIMKSLEICSENTPESHRLRGWLCGIPADEIDERFHERYEAKP
jgi:hypothetical protein